MFDPFGAIGTLRSLAESDSQIRAAAVSGSLTDPQSTPDLFSDCDAAFFVRDLERAKKTDYPARLAPRLGGLMICQCPDAMGAEAGSAPWFTWLMQFEETRIDLRLLPAERAGWYNAMEPGLTPLFFWTRTVCLTGWSPPDTVCFPCTARPAGSLPTAAMNCSEPASMWSRGSARVSWNMPSGT